MSPLLAALLAAAVVLVLWPPAVAVAVVPLLGTRIRRPVRPAVRRAAELEWVEALTSEVRAGRDPGSALLAASVGAGAQVAPEAVVAARSGGEVAAALQADGARSELLRGVAACWSVAEGSGAGLAASLLTLADAARETERVRRELQSGLAEPRATAVVLAALPLVGLLMGTMLGANPIGWLLGSGAGLVVLASGIAFEVLGAWWAWRIATSLEAEL